MSSELDINNSLMDLSFNIHNIDLNYKYARDVLTDISLQKKITDLSNIDISNLLFKIDQLQLLLTNIQQIDLCLNTVS